MKREVVLGKLHEIVLLGASTHGVDQSPKSADKLVSGAGCGAERESLQLGTELVEWVHFIFVRLGHDSAAVGYALHQALLHELAEGLAHRDTAQPRLRGNLPSHQPFADRNLAEKDGVANLFQRDARQVRVWTLTKLN